MSSSTLYRRISLLPRTFRPTAAAQLPTTSARPFSISATRSLGKNDGPHTNSHVNTSNLPDDKHAVDKKNSGDAQDSLSASVKGGLDTNHQTGGSATEQKDTAGGVAKAKKENPEAPDPAIGMQDERGGKGA